MLPRMINARSLMAAVVIAAGGVVALAQNAWAGPAPSILLSTVTMTFNATEGGPNPATQTFDVGNEGRGGTTLNWTGGDDRPWRSMAPTNGAVPQGLSDTVTVTVVTGALTAGVYVCTITIDDPAANDGPQIITVTFNVAPAASPAIGLSTPTLNFVAVEGGSDPPNQLFDVTNTGPGGTNLNWTGGDDMAWLPLAPGSGGPATGSS